MMAGIAAIVRMLGRSATRSCLRTSEYIRGLSFSWAPIRTGAAIGSIGRRFGDRASLGSLPHGPPRSRLPGPRLGARRRRPARRARRQGPGWNRARRVRGRRGRRAVRDVAVGRGPSGLAGLGDRRARGGVRLHDRARRRRRRAVARGGGGRRRHRAVHRALRDRPGGPLAARPGRVDLRGRPRGDRLALGRPAAARRARSTKGSAPSGDGRRRAAQALPRLRRLPANRQARGDRRGGQGALLRRAPRARRADPGLRLGLPLGHPGLHLGDRDRRNAPTATSSAG